MALDEPETVTIRSGHEPSDMFIFAPDYMKKKEIKIDVNLIVFKSDIIIFSHRFMKTFFHHEKNK